MSVLKSRRGESGMQFLENAYNLEVYTLQQALKMPKRYTFYINTALVRLAQECHSCVKAANSIYPTNAHEVQMRRDYFITANNHLQNLLSKLDIAQSVVPIDEKTLETWVGMIVEEARLISAVKQSDKKRFASIA